MENTLYKSKENDMFSELRGLDLLTLLSQIETTNLTYRDTLGVPSFVTLGYEIEYEGIKRSIVDKFISEAGLYSWDSGSDQTVKGGELRSPILGDNKEDWLELRRICKFLQLVKATTNGKSVGGHFHIGTQTIGEEADAWRDFLKLYAIYENVLFRFYYGDKINGREGIKQYAPPMARSVFSYWESMKEFETAKEIVEYFAGSRYRAINFNNVQSFEDASNMNTIEFRCPNGTIDEIILQNNANAALKMLLSAKEGKIDRDFLEFKYKRDRQRKVDNPQFYNIVCLKDALEFVDLVFDNNLDKIYFLRQYLKDFKEALFNQSLIEAPSFVKSKTL